MPINSVFIQSANLNELCITSMLNSPLISQQIINESTKFDGMRQKQFVACRYLLAKILNQYFDINRLPKIIIADNSRPQFEKQNLPNFNISHSEHFVAVALATQGKVGIDIEQNRERKSYLAIAKQFFSSSENSWLNQQTNPLDAFWQLWTLRESALKLYSKGVWQMKEIQIDMPSKQISASFGLSFYPSYQSLEDIHLSVCCSESIDSIILN